MHLQQLKHHFEQQKGHRAESVNQLLDFCQQQYVSGCITYSDYRNLFEVLHEKGAQSSHKDKQMV
ncbi:YppF family protein [Pontibacillus litoralis]|uniref:YppF-like protein n=1 Tax=Pontibacillus litoralis JSM 072002 TaxID=1385512 RepID=A0A0A5G3S8_9BACI|nr:YppF family protein [Pontibacillus litoralis]KGX87776.1 hypothetical protein N784_14305 [Pontibacillus litoralis JSM 072002]